MKLDRIGGWLMLAGGLVFLVDLFVPALKNFENPARLAVAGGAALFLLGHIF